LKESDFSVIVHQVHHGTGALPPCILGILNFTFSGAFKRIRKAVGWSVLFARFAGLDLSIAVNFFVEMGRFPVFSFLCVIPAVGMRVDGGFSAGKI